MAEYSPTTFEIPANKVAIGYIITQYVLDIKDSLKNKDSQAFIALIAGLDNICVQYKDDIYEKEIIQAKKLIDKTTEAQNILRILMKLLQRAGFMPTRAFDEVLKIPDDVKYIPRSEKENGIPAVQET